MWTPDKAADKSTHMAAPFVGHVVAHRNGHPPDPVVDNQHGRRPSHHQHQQHFGLAGGGKDDRFFDSPQAMSDPEPSFDPHHHHPHARHAVPSPEEEEEPAWRPSEPSEAPSYEPRRMEAQLAELQRRRAEQNNHLDFAPSHPHSHQRQHHGMGMEGVGKEARSRFDELLAAAEAERHGGGGRNESLPFDIGGGSGGGTNGRGGVGGIDAVRLRKAVERDRGRQKWRQQLALEEQVQEQQPVPPVEKHQPGPDDHHANGTVEAKANGNGNGEAEDDWVDEPESAGPDPGPHPKHRDFAQPHYAQPFSSSYDQAYAQPHPSHSLGGEEEQYPYAMHDFQHQYGSEQQARQYDSQDEYLEDPHQHQHPHQPYHHPPPPPHEPFPLHASYDPAIDGFDDRDRRGGDDDRWQEDLWRHHREGGDESDLMDLETSLARPLHSHSQSHSHSRSHEQVQEQPGEWARYSSEPQHLSPGVGYPYGQEVTSSPGSQRSRSKSPRRDRVNGVYPASAGHHSHSHLRPRAVRQKARKKKALGATGGGGGSGGREGGGARRELPYEESEESPSTAYSPKSSRRSEPEGSARSSPLAEAHTDVEDPQPYHSPSTTLAHADLPPPTGHGHVLEASGETIPDFLPTDSSSMSSMGRAHASTAIAAIVQARKLSRLSLGAGVGGGKDEPVGVGKATLTRMKSAPVVMGELAGGRQDSGAWTDESDDLQLPTHEEPTNLADSSLATAGDLTRARARLDSSPSLALTANEVERTTSPYGNDRHGKVAQLLATRQQSRSSPTVASQTFPTMASATSAVPHRGLEPWHYGASASNESGEGEGTASFETYDGTSQAADSNGVPASALDLSLGTPPPGAGAATVPPMQHGVHPHQEGWEDEAEAAEGQRTPTASSMAGSRTDGDSLNGHSASASEQSLSASEGSVGLQAPAMVRDHQAPAQTSAEAEQLKAARQALRREIETPVRGGGKVPPAVAAVVEETPGSMSSSDPDLGLSPITVSDLASCSGREADVYRLAQEEATVDVRAAEMNNTPPTRRPLPFRLNNFVTSPSGLASSRVEGTPHTHESPAPAEAAATADPTPDTPYAPDPSTQPDTPPDDFRSLVSTPSPIRLAMGMPLRPRKAKPLVKPPPPISLPAHTRRGPLKDELHREELREWNEATGTDDRYALPLHTLPHSASGETQGTARRLTGVGNEERRGIKDRWGNVWGMESHLLSPLT